MSESKTKLAKLAARVAELEQELERRKTIDGQNAAVITFNGALKVQLAAMEKQRNQALARLTHLENSIPQVVVAIKGDVTAALDRLQRWVGLMRPIEERPDVAARQTNS
jgi:xanthine/CO dehydrogenase XdhC/CoxF family maturation factor